MDCSLPGSSIHGITGVDWSGLRVLEWVAISFSRGSSWPRDWIRVSHIVGRRFTVWATGKSTREEPPGKFLYELYYNCRGEHSLFRNISTDIQWKMIKLEYHHSLTLEWINGPKQRSSVTDRIRKRKKNRLMNLLTEVYYLFSSLPNTN